MTNTFTIINNPHPSTLAPKGIPEPTEGNADSQQLAKDWAKGKGNTKDSNFVTPGDEADTRTVEEALEKKGVTPAFTGEY